MSRRDVVRVAVLGPIEVIRADGSDATPAGHLPRRLLALLVMRRGHGVSVGTAVDLLWPAVLPADPVGALQNHISRLRQCLPQGAIQTTGDGYRLDPAVVDVDADRLSNALTVGSTDDAHGADIDAMLAGWHGPAYPELDDLDDARAEVQRLEELRVRAKETSAESRLVAGQTDGLAAELRALADEHPLRERPHALLMEVLAATGRRAEALRVYDAFRRELGDELGTEPSLALSARHHELLVGDDTIGWSPGGRPPVPSTPLIGRDELVAELTTCAPHTRMLTLVGPGGAGKTRLLLEVGHRLVAARPDVPVVWCDLSRADRSGTGDVITRALKIDARPGVPLAERVAGVIDDAELVLLLDNCEHVLEPAVEFVERIVADCPRLRVVATSRERLRVAGEQVRSVPPLSVTQPTSPAVELFVSRARASADGLELDDDAMGCIEEIVKRLDGLPLAIELAAARTLTHDVEEIAAGLDQRFDLLSSGYRASSRHASLTAAVSWSYRLLDVDLQRTFCDLSAFAGPFDVAGAAAVCDLDAAIAHKMITELVERSLVRRAGSRRYRMLETLQAFGRERLAIDGRQPDVAARHARYLVDWTKRARARLSQPGERVVAEIDEAVPELQRALDWLLAHDEVERAGQLVIELFDYGFLRLRPDVLAWAERVAAADPDDHNPWAAPVLGVAAYATWMAGDVAKCGQRAAHALRVAHPEQTPPIVFAANGAFALFEGRLQDSADWYGRAADAATASDPAFRHFAEASRTMVLGYADDPSVPGLVDANLTEVGDAVTPYAAYVWYCAGEAELAVGDSRAAARFVRALELAAATDAAFVTGTAGASKASIDARTGDPNAAAEAYEALIMHWRRAGMWPTQWTMLRSIAVLLERRGAHYDAAVLASAAGVTTAGHRLFGADEIMLNELAARLRAHLGDEVFEAARRQGCVLDGEAAVEHALRALRTDGVTNGVARR